MREAVLQQHVLNVPVRISFRTLDPEQEDSFVATCMAQPGNCDNDLSKEENRAWFAEIWRQQIRLQRALRDDPQFLRDFLWFVVLDRVCGAGKGLGEVSRIAVAGLDLEEVIQLAAEAIGAVDHFFPSAALGVDTWSMVSDLLDAVTVEIDGRPAIA